MDDCLKSKEYDTGFLLFWDFVEPYFPQRLRELREKHKVSQRKLAELIGVSHVTISKIERGKMAISVKVIAGYMHIFKCSIDDFIWENDTKLLPQLSDTVSKRYTIEGQILIEQFLRQIDDYRRKDTFSGEP
jgi:transcriptional regulator with XRE-family HTH domain